MADYKGTNFMGGPIPQHKALAMGLNPKTGAEDKRNMVNAKKAAPAKKASGKK